MFAIDRLVIFVWALFAHVAHIWMLIFLVLGRDAWSSLGNMTKEEAMINYVDDIQLVSSFSINSDVVKV